ncbi:MAG: hypothetical protein OEL89_02585 [Candidatus Peregrinibacteria bacterium]|nr:hypothetical protein [Candidatus Peregrinibacteria bacterium]
MDMKESIERLKIIQARVVRATDDKKLQEVIPTLYKLLERGDDK